MAHISTWESIFLVLMMLAIGIFFFPSMKRAIKASKDAPKDWMGLLIPLAAVAAFVVFLTQLL